VSPGPPGCNKSAAWRTLAAAWGLGARGATTFRDLNPKAVTTRELYGYVSATTREWHDGILPALMREFAGAADARPKWMVLDGEVRYIYIYIYICIYIYMYIFVYIYICIYVCVCVCVCVCVYACIYRERGGAP